MHRPGGRCHSAILWTTTPKGHADARIPLYDSPRDRSDSHRLQGGLPPGTPTPPPRPRRSPWYLSLLRIRVSWEIFALGHRVHLSAPRDHLLRPPRRIPPSE